MSGKIQVKKVISLFLVFALVLGFALTTGQKVSAKTKELSASLMQKSNSLYNSRVKDGFAVAYKVKLKKNTIVINGALQDDNTRQITDIGIYTYKLLDGVKYYVGGGAAPAQELSKKEFKKCLEKNKDSGLGLVLEFQKSKISTVTITS